MSEELIDEGRFAVVNVRDDRDIADIHLRFFLEVIPNTKPGGLGTPGCKGEIVVQRIQDLGPKGKRCLAFAGLIACQIRHFSGPQLSVIDI